MNIPGNTSQLPMAPQPEQSPLNTTLAHPANHYQVGRRVTLGKQTWVITALDFIFNKAILLQVTEEGAIDYDGEKREIPLMEVPWESL